jgi:hypothetical protein
MEDSESTGMINGVERKPFARTWSFLSTYWWAEWILWAYLIFQITIYSTVIIYWFVFSLTNIAGVTVVESEFPIMVETDVSNSTTTYVSSYIFKPNSIGFSIQGTGLTKTIGAQFKLALATDGNAKYVGSTGVGLFTNNAGVQTLGFFQENDGRVVVPTMTSYDGVEFASFAGTILENRTTTNMTLNAYICKNIVVFRANFSDQYQALRGYSAYIKQSNLAFDADQLAVYDSTMVEQGRQIRLRDSGLVNVTLVRQSAFNALMLSCIQYTFRAIGL